MVRENLEAPALAKLEVVAIVRYDAVLGKLWHGVQHVSLVLGKTTNRTPTFSPSTQGKGRYRWSR